jgi:hypothetical protein
MPLTEADLQLMRSLTKKLNERICGNTSLTATQRDAFSEEDDAPPGPTFAYYEAGLPAMLEGELRRAILTGGRDIARPVSQGLKRLFLRPRPQLTALLLGCDDLAVQASKSAITPSMISGHCVQGVLALAQVQYSMGDLLNSRAGLLDDVQRFLIDTGDRRVFAGLHYPSDNIGSWFVAMRLCKHVFGEKADEIRRSLWSAIQGHSAVYQAIVEASKHRSGSGGKGGESSPYLELLARLQSTATTGYAT